MSYIMETQNLTKTYGTKDAAKDINIHIREGEIYGLIGRNGAGKTTIMRMISGLSNPTSGTYSLFGKTGSEMKKMMNKVGVLIENPGLYPKLSAQENIKIKCIGMGVDSSKEYVNNLLDLVGLPDVSPKKKSGEFSLGMRQRLGIALALVGEPSMIILDEPINGLDPQGIVEVRHTLERLSKEKGITIMISSHILEELSKLANSYGIINEGHLIEQFTSEELHSRCGQFVTIKTSDNDAAIKALNSAGITMTSIDEDGHIRVSEKLDESDLMASAIVKAGVPLKELFITNVSLEDYFISLTGGAVR
ncbi:MAG: ATP-binding cassette domain-containing protein [Lachnospiraceae bacterium]|nr:ATP-binding cassette domain-containing protein [Lachnospiraceae bacterium]MBQ3967836.1 ATP-binding cassette domain-containing protein [Lachnospiraceae bacterium]